MFTEKTVNPPRRWSNAGVVAGLLLLMMGALQVVRAQETQINAKDIQVRRKAELHSRGKGRVIAEGRNSNVSKHVPVERFTVEEIQLDEPIEAELEGKKTDVFQAYRITMFGGPFDLRSMPITLKIDDKTTLIGVESPKLDKVTFVLFDRTLLLESPTLTVGYGAVSIELSDKLNLSEPRQ
ncbi:MAG TPA: hypothetical protein VFI24_27945 [Pyrinomonadaceae bacterium]|nr:hypothetical protein [Pyrinomonadaceae bacterium]